MRNLIRNSLNLLKVNFQLKTLHVGKTFKHIKKKLTIKKKEIARQIYEMYMNGAKSQLEVNIPGSYCVKVKEKMETSQVVKTLFDDVENALIVNISDTYSRFIFTEEYNMISKEIAFIQSFTK